MLPLGSDQRPIIVKVKTEEKGGRLLKSATISVGSLSWVSNIPRI